MQTVVGLSNERPHLEKEEVPQQSDSARELKKVRIMLSRPAQQDPAANICAVCAYQKRSPQNDMQYRSYSLQRGCSLVLLSISLSRHLGGMATYQSCYLTASVAWSHCK